MSCGIYISSTLLNFVQLLSKILYSLFILISLISKFSLLHIFDNSWYFQNVSILFPAWQLNIWHYFEFAILYIIHFFFHKCTGSHSFFFSEFPFNMFANSSTTFFFLIFLLVYKIYIHLTFRSFLLYICVTHIVFKQSFKFVFDGVLF